MKNVETLHKEKVIDKEKLTKDEHKAINALSDEEVEQMVKIHKKLKGDMDGPVGFPL